MRKNIPEEKKTSESIRMEWVHGRSQVHGGGRPSLEISQAVLLHILAQKGLFLVQFGQCSSTFQVLILQVMVGLLGGGGHVGTAPINNSLQMTPPVWEKV